ncbi:Uncharacterised protein [Legionella sainthelensi]|nr:Uncharacterised protein [Legionella sainthelensi]
MTTLELCLTQRHQRHKMPLMAPAKLYKAGNFIHEDSVQIQTVQYKKILFFFLKISNTSS